MLLNNRLRDASHRIEREIAPLVESEFPNYEFFWDKFLIPITGSPENLNWRIDTHPNLEQMGMAAFGILKSINFINRNKVFIQLGDPDQRFKNIYFHFGLIADNVEAIARCICIMRDITNIELLHIKLKLSKSKLIESFENWINNKYDDAYLHMITEGRPIFYYPQHDNSFLSKLLNTEQKKEYVKFIGEVKEYRNLFAHNPSVDIIGGQQLNVLKKEYLKHSKSWAGILDSNRKEMFTDPIEMANADLHTLIELLNAIWEIFIPKVEEFYTSLDFDNYLKGYNRNKQ